MQETNPIIAEFLEEARVICGLRPFLGPPNQAMFWAHIPDKAKTADLLLSFKRNFSMCNLYREKANPLAYAMQHSDRLGLVPNFFNRYENDYPPDVTMKAWNVFSTAFAVQAIGDHAYVAVNDAMPDDWFIECELPVMKGKFTKITTIEPTISSDGCLAIKETGWQFDEWLDAQQAQWEKPFHYLDGTQYPTALIIP